MKIKSTLFHLSLFLFTSAFAVVRLSLATAEDYPRQHPPTNAIHGIGMGMAPIVGYPPRLEDHVFLEEVLREKYAMSNQWYYYDPEHSVSNRTLWLIGYLYSEWMPGLYPTNVVDHVRDFPWIIYPGSVDTEPKVRSYDSQSSMLGMTNVCDLMSSCLYTNYGIYASMAFFPTNHTPVAQRIADLYTDAVTNDSLFCQADPYIMGFSRYGQESSVNENLFDGWVDEEPTFSDSTRGRSWTNNYSHVSPVTHREFYSQSCNITRTRGIYTWNREEKARAPSQQYSATEIKEIPVKTLYRIYLPITNSEEVVEGKVFADFTITRTSLCTETGHYQEDQKRITMFMDDIGNVAHRNGRWISYEFELDYDDVLEKILRAVNWHPWAVNEVEAICPFPAWPNIGTMSSTSAIFTNRREASASLSIVINNFVAILRMRLNARVLDN